MTNDAPAIDPAVIETLREVMEDNFTLLLETYLADASERIEKLKPLQLSADADAIRKLAHSLKGSSSNLGALHLAELCLRLEEKGRTGNLQGIELDVAAIKTEFTRVNSVLRSYL